MQLLDIIHRQPRPEPWREGDNIPWNQPDFSERMLQEHLSQQHNAASRRFEIIDRQVDWIHQTLLLGRPARILDLGCGPGLYTSRLARLGHECVGIDFSPASINYAATLAREERLTCTYSEQDIRQADYGSGYALAMLIFGEFNVFSRADAGLILSKVYRALKPEVPLSGGLGGILLLEPHTFEMVKKIGREPAVWEAVEQGLFSERPHLSLIENFWDAESCTATSRYYIIDAQTGTVTRYAHSFQAYSNQEYQAFLAQHGFSEVAFFSSLSGVVEEGQDGLMVIVARKQGL
jgi:SAM-dependent methyltransferase